MKGIHHRFRVIREIFNAHKYPLLVLFLTWGVFFAVLFGRILQERPDGLYFGHTNVWSDWALHVSQANIFAFKHPSEWFAYHPMWAGGKFTYPFLTNFISGMLMRAGASLTFAFIFPSVVFILALLGGMYTLLYVLFRSKWQPVMAISIFFLSSGLGFIHFIRNMLANPSWAAFSYPTIEYTRMENFNWYTGNVVVGLLIPQRAFLLGMTVGIWALAGLVYATTKKDIPPLRRNFVLFTAGAAAGILPITHTHSFIVITILAGIFCLFHVRQWRSLLRFVVPAGIISGTFFLTFIYGGIENDAFIRWHPGWTSKGGLFGWLDMWWLLWGTMLPLAVCGFVWVLKKGRKEAKIFIGGAFLLFALGNLFLFQPIPWDNTKIFWWAYFGFSAAVSFLLARLWERSITSKIMVVLLTISLTGTGFVELLRFARISKHTFLETSAKDMKLGEQIRRATLPDAVFLTAPAHNHFVMLWALRPIVMGYTAWVLNFGFPYQEREKDVYAMYAGGKGAIALLRKYKVSYVAIGPTELYDLRPDEQFFARNFPVAFRNANYRVYDTRSLLAGTLSGPGSDR